MLWYLALGISTGMRTMTAMAVLCWFGWLRLLPMTGWAFWAGNLISAIVFTVCALGEYYGDTLPSTPSRTKPMLLMGRLMFGGLVGALGSNTNGDPLVGGVLFAWVGVLIGAYGGVRLRLYFGSKVGRDLPVALAESAMALMIALGAAVGLHRVVVVMMKAAAEPS